MSSTHFYVQAGPREPWHVESDEDCEAMLCGLRVSVEASARLSSRPGKRWCPDCWMKLEVQHRIERLAPHAEPSRIPSRFGL